MTPSPYEPVRVCVGGGGGGGAGEGRVQSHHFGLGRLKPSKQVTSTQVFGQFQLRLETPCSTIYKP